MTVKFGKKSILWLNKAQILTETNQTFGSIHTTDM